MPRFALVESLESRMFLSASSLPQAQAALSTATSTLNADQATAAEVIAADKANVAAAMRVHTASLAPLQNVLKQDQAARASILSMDRANLKIALSNDQSIIIGLRNDIRTDKIQNNTVQLKIDKAQLAKDLASLQTDRNTLNATLQHDIITTAATLRTDKAALVKAIRNHGNSALAQDKHTLISDERLWTKALARDRKAVAHAKRAVTIAKHG